MYAFVLSCFWYVCIFSILFQAEVTTYEDGVFSVKIGPQVSETSEISASCSIEMTSGAPAFLPNPRMNANLVVKHGILYLYGGLCEDGDRQLTLSDFYSLDIHKLDEWNIIVPFSSDTLEWIESEESESDSEGSDVEMDENSDSNSEGIVFL